MPLLETPELLSTLAIEKLILAENGPSIIKEDFNLCLTSLADQGQVSDCLTDPFQAFSSLNRKISREEALHQQYPTFSKSQLAQLFTSYWTDDIDLVFFYDCPQTGAQGHLNINGLNLSLEPALPLASWLSGIDSKVLAGRALFERTFQERKELINSLLKSKMSESSPVRVILSYTPEMTLKDGYVFALIESNNFPFRIALLPIKVLIGNTSWLNEAEYEFEVVDSRY